MTDPVLIVGAGIGGLSTALALHARGIEVRIFESVRDIQALGVGINLLPHATRVLDELGLLPALRASGIETQELIYFNKFGQLIWREPRGLAAGYPVPQISIHRGELQRLLLSAVLERLGEDALHTGHTALRAQTEGDAARLFLRDAQGAEQTVVGRCVVAADGIHSAIRAQHYPDEGMPIWNGAVMWRGLSPTDPFLGGRTMFMAGHQNQKFVCYPVDRAAYEAGRSMTNWIAEKRYPVTQLAQREDWNRQGNFAEFAPDFASWRFDWLDIPALIEEAQACFEFPMVDRDPVERWTFGRVTLLGDAAHPMYPIGSNGASQAILDAHCLSTQLSRHLHAPAAALQAYEAERLPATAAIVRANRGNGPEQVMQMAEERAPEGFDDIDAVIPLAEREEIAARYKQVAGFLRTDVAAPVDRSSGADT